MEDIVQLWDAAAEAEGANHLMRRAHGHRRNRLVYAIADKVWRNKLLCTNMVDESRTMNHRYDSG